MSDGERLAAQEHEGLWLCRYLGCGQPVEANPVLYLSLLDDGTWFIDGVRDNETSVVCTEGHDQLDQVLEKSMTAYLEERFPGGTWQGSAPQ